MLKSVISALIVLAAIVQQVPTKLIDNDRVTVWDTTWPKGKPTSNPAKFDQVTIELGDALLKITKPDGKSTLSTLKFGQATFIPKGTTQIEEGASDPARRAIVIDLKDAELKPIENNSGYPDAFPRDGIKKLMDNARLTIWDYTWTPGKTTAMHFHTRDVVTIYMADGEIRSTEPDGTAKVNVNKIGLARFNPRNRTHTEELIKGKGRAIIVELK